MFLPSQKYFLPQVQTEGKWWKTVQNSQAAVLRKGQQQESPPHQQGRREKQEDKGKDRRSKGSFPPRHGFFRPRKSKPMNKATTTETKRKHVLQHSNKHTNQNETTNPANKEAKKQPKQPIKITNQPKNNQPKNNQPKQRKDRPSDRPRQFIFYALRLIWPDIFYCSSCLAVHVTQSFSKTEKTRKLAMDMNWGEACFASQTSDRDANRLNHFKPQNQTQGHGTRTPLSQEPRNTGKEDTNTKFEHFILDILLTGPHWPKGSCSKKNDQVAEPIGIRKNPFCKCNKIDAGQGSFQKKQDAPSGVVVGW